MIAAFFMTFGISWASARDFKVDIVMEGLNSPTGIAARSAKGLYFSEIPTPNVGGGSNTVKFLNLRNGRVSVISEGEPNPVNIALGRRGNVYWTCQTAGVILKYNRHYGKSLFLDELMMPSGITVDRNGDVLFTELPMPGTPGANSVSVSDGEHISLISDGEPAPTDIVIARNGTAYWTCSTAGVILKRSPAGVISLLLDGLAKPTGIALDRKGENLYYTELPTPGVFDGDNKVMELNLNTMEKSVVAAGFPLPADVTVALNGKIYWTCTTAGVIASATPQGH